MNKYFFLSSLIELKINENRSDTFTYFMWRNTVAELREKKKTNHVTNDKDLSE